MKKYKYKVNNKEEIKEYWDDNYEIDYYEGCNYCYENCDEIIRINVIGSDEETSYCKKCYFKYIANLLISEEEAKVHNITVIKERGW